MCRYVRVGIRFRTIGKETDVCMQMGGTREWISTEGVYQAYMSTL